MDDIASEINGRRLARLTGCRMRGKKEKSQKGGYEANITRVALMCDGVASEIIELLRRYCWQTVIVTIYDFYKLINCGFKQ